MKKIGLSLLSFISGYVTAIYTNRKKSHSVEQSLMHSEDRLNEYYMLLNCWLKLKQNQISLQSFFIQNDYKKIAIYGLGELGQRLYDELVDTEIHIAYAVDQNVENQSLNIEIYKTEDDLPHVDVIVITPVFAFEAIEKKLNAAGHHNIISLDEVIYSL